MKLSNCQGFNVLSICCQVRESTGARIIFPSQEDQDQELITIIGTKESVAEAKTEILALIKDLVRNIVPLLPKNSSGHFQAKCKTTRSAR